MTNALEQVIADIEFATQKVVGVLEVIADMSHETDNSLQTWLDLQRNQWERMQTLKMKLDIANEIVTEYYNMLAQSEAEDVSLLEREGQSPGEELSLTETDKAEQPFPYKAKREASLLKKRNK